MRSVMHGSGFNVSRIGFWLSALACLGCSPESERVPVAAFRQAVVTVEQQVPNPAGSFSGVNVATAGDWAMVGMPGDRDVASAAGAVQLYRFVSGSWQAQPKLTASDADADDNFGRVVAMSGTLAVIGARGDDEAASGAGAAYVFELSGTTWMQIEKLMASNATADASFGSHVAISGSSVLVTAPVTETAYYFERSGQTWAEAQVTGVPSITSVALAPDLIALGAENPRRAVAFERVQGVWTPAALPTIPGIGMGVSIAASADTIVVGCPHTATSEGHVVPLRKSGGNWVAGNPIVASDRSQNMYFGQSLALTTDFMLVGAYGKDSYTGGVYLFVRTGDAYSEELILNPSNPGSSDQLGTNAALGSRAALSGGSFEAFFYTLLGEDGDACGANVDCEHGHCVEGVCCNEACAASGQQCSTGTCMTEPGFMCSSGQPCDSGFCVDGVCCESACSEQCEACDLPGLEGQCVAVSGAPRGERSPCAGFGSECGSACDGALRTECKFVAANMPCGAGSCLNGVAQSSVCNGAGACEAEPLVSCGQYACGETGCKLDCADDLDCADGYQCSESACIPAQPRCSDDASSALDAEGEVVEICSPYLCVNAQCAEACSVSTDCQVGYSCDSATMTCIAASQPAAEDGGCGCRVGASGTAGGRALGLVALCFGLLCRRRRHGA